LAIHASSAFNEDANLLAFTLSDISKRVDALKEAVNPTQGVA
jgi:hypothetical protein